jgi:CDP-diacylglycerol--glycerol-3-phosphate 3-phosphatidyltransferase/cardiolipin synthase
VGKYRAADLVNAPTLLSLARLPLAVLFPFTLERPALSIAVLGAAAASDVLDGFIARRFELATATGAVVDGVTDKLFAAVVLASLVLGGRLALADVALLGAREIVELPFIAWLALSAAARRSKIDERANVIGKAATTLQFAAVFLVLIRSDLRTWAVWATAVVGAAAGMSYWARAFGDPPKTLVR